MSSSTARRVVLMAAAVAGLLLLAAASARAAEDNDDDEAELDASVPMVRVRAWNTSSCSGPVRSDERLPVDGRCSYSRLLGPSTYRKSGVLRRNVVISLYDAKNGTKCYNRDLSEVFRNRVCASTVRGGFFSGYVRVDLL